jgi:hypothetical protein
MRRLGFSPRGMVQLGPSSSPENRSLAGFEELAIPLFDSLYNFARWLTKNQIDAEDLAPECSRGISIGRLVWSGPHFKNGILPRLGQAGFT